MENSNRTHTGRRKTLLITVHALLAVILITIPILFEFSWRFTDENSVKSETGETMSYMEFMEAANDFIFENQLVQTPVLNPDLFTMPDENSDQYAALSEMIGTDIDVLKRITDNPDPSFAELDELKMLEQNYYLDEKFTDELFPVIRSIRFSISYRILTGGDTAKAVKLLNEYHVMNFDETTANNGEVVEWVKNMYYHTNLDYYLFYIFPMDLSLPVTRDFVYSVINEILVNSFTNYYRQPETVNYADYEEALRKEIITSLYGNNIAAVTVEDYDGAGYPSVPEINGLLKNASEYAESNQENRITGNEFSIDFSKYEPAK